MLILFVLSLLYCLTWLYWSAVIVPLPFNVVQTPPWTTQFPRLSLFLHPLILLLALCCDIPLSSDCLYPIPFSYCRRSTSLPFSISTVSGSVSRKTKLTHIVKSRFLYFEVSLHGASSSPLSYLGLCHFFVLLAIYNLYYSYFLTCLWFRWDANPL